MSMFDFLQPKVDVQVNMPPRRPTDIDSEIDWKIIDQLHNVVLNFSKNSMEAKKIMFSLLGIFVAAMLRVPTLCSIIKWLPVVIGIVVLFWAFDAYTYYYQEKLRADMNAKFKTIKDRYPGGINKNEYTLPEKRQKGCRIWRSFFNCSVLFYPAIIIIVIVCWILIEKGVII